MEKTIAPRPVRNAYRRVLAKVGLSMVVLGGGSWATYHFTMQEPDGNSAVAHSAAESEDQLNTDELKQLFASGPPTKSEAPNPGTSRYTLSSSKSANGLDELITPTSSAEPLKTAEAPAANPAATTSSAILGDRYASIAISSPAESEPEPKEIAEQPQQTEPELAGPEVTRGQEPENYNPLRASLPANRNPGGTATAIKRTSAEGSTTDEEMFAGSQPLPTQAPAPSSGSRYPEPGPLATNPAPMAVSAAPTPAAPEAGRIPPVEMAATGPPAAAYSQPPQPVPMEAAAMPNVAALPRTDPKTVELTPTPGLTNTPGTGRPGERLLEGPQNPSVTIQKLAPEEIQVGRRCTFAIRVQNTGQRTAQGVRILDEVPLGTELVGTAPRASVSGSQVVWEIGTLSVGEERTVEMELIPREEGDLGSVASVTFATQASAKARCTRPELALRLSSKPQVHAGENQLVQVEISNPGSGEATNVMLLESVPQGVSHEAGPALEFEVGNLNPGETRRLELVLTAEAAGKVINEMTARADAGLQVQASCEFEVIAPSLQVTVDGPKKRYLERPATYQVSIDNPGTAAAKEVQLVTELPKGLQFVSANNMGEYDASSHSVYWSLAELPANERGTVELVALPIETGEHTLKVSTTAQQGLNDKTEAHVKVDGIVALMFEVVDLESPIEIGGETSYEIRVVNQGSKAASNVQVGAIMPQGMRAISGEGESRHAIQGEKVIFAPLASLAPKAESVFRIQAQGLRAGDQRVRVQVVSDEVRQPITKEVSTRVYADQ